MRKPVQQDPGYVRWFMFIPDTGVFTIPAWVPVENRVEYARNSGATLVRRELEVIWRADGQPEPSSRLVQRRHLAVVR